MRRGRGLCRRAKEVLHGNRGGAGSLAVDDGIAAFDGDCGARFPPANESAAPLASGPIVDEPATPGNEPDVPVRDSATDVGVMSSPPVAVVDVAGAALRAGGLASTLPAAPLLASPTLGKRSGRSARDLAEPLFAGVRRQSVCAP